MSSVVKEVEAPELLLPPAEDILKAQSKRGEWLCAKCSPLNDYCDVKPSIFYMPAHSPTAKGSPLKSLRNSPSSPSEEPAAPPPINSPSTPAHLAKLPALARHTF
jgi:hypothetical protein